MLIYLSLLVLLSTSQYEYVQARTAEMELTHFQLTARLPKKLSDQTVVLGNDDRLYISGGCDSGLGNIFLDDGDSSFFFCPSVSSSFYAFSPGNRTFEVLKDMPRERYRHAVVAIQNHIFHVGGRDVHDNVLHEVDVSIECHYLCYVVVESHHLTAFLGL